MAIEILHMRLHGQSKKDDISDIILSTGRQLLATYQFKNNRANQMDYKLSNLIRACLTGDDATEDTRILSNNLFNALKSYDIYPGDYRGVLKALATMQPLTFISSFLDKGKLVGRINSVFSDEMDPLSVIDDDTIINWCEYNPEVRYPIVASTIRPYQKNENKNKLEWTPLALKIIDNYSNPLEVLDQFKSILRPMSWSISRAEVMQHRLCLISDLKNHGNNSIADWARNEESVFEQEIRSEREWELNNERDRNESFE